MKRFSTLNEYLIESQGNFHKLMNRDARKELLIAIKESGYYDDMINFGIDVILENNLTNKLYEGTLSGEEFSGYVNELAVIDWAKDKFKKAKEKVKELGNDALDTLDGASEFLLKIGGNIMKIPKMIGDVLAGAMKTSWEWIKKAVYAGKNAAFEKEDANEVAEKASKWPEEDLEKLDTEIDAAKKMCESIVEWVTGDLAKAAEKGAEKGYKEVEAGGDKNESYYYNYSTCIEQAALIGITELIKEDSSIISEIESFNSNAINEGDEKGWKLPFISKVMHFIAKNIPPFSILHKIEGLAGKVAGGIFNIISAIVQFLRTGSFKGYQEFEITGKIAGMISVKIGEHSVKHMSMEVMKKIITKAVSYTIIKAVPAVGTFWGWLEKAATAIWYLEVIELVIGLVYKIVKARNPNSKFIKAMDVTKKGQILGNTVRKAQDAIDKGKDSIKKGIDKVATLDNDN
jgi:hypothetical protein